MRTTARTAVRFGRCILCTQASVPTTLRAVASTRANHITRTLPQAARISALSRVLAQKRDRMTGCEGRSSVNVTQTRERTNPVGQPLGRLMANPARRLVLIGARVPGSGARRARQPLIACHKLAAEQLGEGDIAGVIGGDVVAQAVGATHQRQRRVTVQIDALEVADRGPKPARGQRARKPPPPQHRHRLEVHQIRGGELPAARSSPRARFPSAPSSAIAFASTDASTTINAGRALRRGPRPPAQARPSRRRDGRSGPGPPRYWAARPGARARRRGIAAATAPRRSARRTSAACTPSGTSLTNTFMLTNRYHMGTGGRARRGSLSGGVAR